MWTPGKAEVDAKNRHDPGPPDCAPDVRLRNHDRGSHQRVVIRSDPPGATVFFMPSRLQQVKTPAEVRLLRRESSTIHIEKPGYRSVTAELESVDDYAALIPYLGNILIGGIIGMVVDLSSGALMELSPDVVDVVLELDLEEIVSVVSPEEIREATDSRVLLAWELTRTKLAEEVLQRAVPVPRGRYSSGVVRRSTRSAS